MGCNATNKPSLSFHEATTFSRVWDIIRPFRFLRSFVATEIPGYDTINFTKKVTRKKAVQYLSSIHFIHDDDDHDGDAEQQHTKGVQAHSTFLSHAQTTTQQTNNLAAAENNNHSSPTNATTTQPHRHGRTNGHGHQLASTPYVRVTTVQPHAVQAPSQQQEEDPDGARCHQRCARSGGK